MTRQRALHWSALKHVGRSPLHYQYATRTAFKQTPPMRLGTIVHHLLLGGPHEPVLFGGGSRRGKAWDEFSAEHQGETIVLGTEMATAQAMADAVRCDPIAYERLQGAQEMSLEWTIAGRLCAGRIDVANQDLVELKSTNDADPARFHWQARKLQYEAQLGWYWDGLLAAGKPEPRLACIVAVESAPPHPVVVYELTPELLDVGRKRARALLERLLVCEASDSWPGYTQSPVSLDLHESEHDGPDLDFGDSETEAA